MMLGEKLYDICQPLFRSVSRVWCFEMLLWSWYIHATQNKNYQDHLMASKQQLRRCCAATSKLRIWVPLGQWVFCQLRRPRLMGCLGDAWDAHGMRPKFFSSQFHFCAPSLRTWIILDSKPAMKPSSRVTQRRTEPSPGITCSYFFGTLLTRSTPGRLHVQSMNIYGWTIGWSRSVTAWN